MESSNNLLGRARQHFDLDGAAQISEASSPSPSVCLGVKIADKNIRSRLRHSCQLPHHRSQVMDVADNERADNKVENR
jgi:hypothetical protein